MLKRFFLILPSSLQKIFISFYNGFIRFSTRNKSSLKFWKDHRKLQPLSNIYGLDRGQAIDRYYIENFLEKNKKDINGTVLELLNSNYTRKYGQKNIVRSDILDIDLTNKNANVYADLAKAESVESDTYDCFILTQTLQFIFDFRNALYHSYRILKPGGTLLVTLPCVSRIDCVAGTDSDFWRFTKASANKMFSEFFPSDSIQIEVYGNVLVCTSFLMGLASEELKKEELSYYDSNFPLLVCIRAVKPAY